MAGSSVIGNLSVLLSLNTAAFSAGAAKAEKEAGRLQGAMGRAGSAIKGSLAGLAAGFTIGAVTSAISQGLEYASSLGEVAQQLGVTTTALQEYRYAATQTGIAEGEMDASLAKLSRTIGEAKQGSAPLQAAFAKIGITMDELAGKDTGEVMRMIAEGLKTLPDPAERAAVAVDLLGRGAQKLMPLLNEGRTGIDAYAKAAKDLGIVIDEAAIKKADEAADTMSKLNTVLQARIAGVVAENSGAIIKLAESLGTLAGKALGVVGSVGQLTAKLRSGEWKGAWDSFMGVAQASVKLFENTIITLPGQIGHYVGQMVVEVGRWIGGKLAEIWDWAIAKIHKVGEAFKWLEDVVVRHSYIPDMVDGIGYHMARLTDEMVKPAQAAAAQTAAAFSRLQSEIDQSFASRPGYTGDDLGKSAGQEEMEDILHQVAEEDFPDFSKSAGKHTAEVAASFATMSTDVIGSVRSMVDGFKRGDTWDGIMQVLDMVSKVAGAFAGAQGGGGMPIGAQGGFGGFRAMGGPVVPGKSYIVGENGPEWLNVGSRGYVTPENGGGGRAQRVEIVPSPYFNVVVDGRIQKQAGPIAVAGMRGGAALATSESIRRARRMLPTGGR